MVEQFTQEDVDQYHTGLGRIFKWLKLAFATRKTEILRRKLLAKRAREERESCIQQEEDRKQRRAEHLQEQHEKWLADYAEELEIFAKWEEREAKKAAGEEVEDTEEDEDGNKIPPPVKPVFNEEEVHASFDERSENQVVTIPPEVELEFDEDWPMTPDEEFDLIDKFAEGVNPLAIR